MHSAEFVVEQCSRKYGIHQDGEDLAYVEREIVARQLDLNRRVVQTYPELDSMVDRLLFHSILRGATPVTVQRGYQQEEMYVGPDYLFLLRAARLDGKCEDKGLPLFPDESVVYISDGKFRKAMGRINRVRRHGMPSYSEFLDLVGSDEAIIAKHGYPITSDMVSPYTQRKQQPSRSNKFSQTKFNFAPKFRARHGVVVPAQKATPLERKSNGQWKKR